MNYRFIDVGAYDGDTIRLFMRKRKLPVPPSQFSIYAFEPNPAMWLDLTSLPFDNIVSIDNRAAWVEDGKFPFAVDTNDLAYGSTLMQSKEAIWNQFDKVQTECFDFSNWIKQFEGDFVIVKMDVEGAEFPILQKMLNDNTVGIMNQLWVEMHPNKVRAYTTEDSNQLIEEVSKHTEVTLWH